MSDGAGDTQAAEDGRTRVIWRIHAWLDCGCGGHYEVDERPALRGPLYCYWHKRTARINRWSGEMVTVASEGFGVSS